MPQVTIVIPWRPQPSRIDAFERVTAWYADQLPELEVRVIDTDDELFNLSRCRNTAVEAEPDPDAVLVIHDADTLPERGALLEAIASASAGSRVQLPYTEYHWLGAAGSTQYAAGTPLDQCSYELVRGACSGVYVTTPRTWQAHGGQDERFRGWGFEDAAWYIAHTTMLGGPPERQTGRVYALHHVAAERAGTQYEANAALMERYRAASGDVEAMSQLVAEAVTARNARSGPES